MLLVVILEDSCDDFYDDLIVIVTSCWFFVICLMLGRWRWDDDDVTMMTRTLSVVTAGTGALSSPRKARSLLLWRMARCWRMMLALFCLFSVLLFPLYFVVFVVCCRLVFVVAFVPLSFGTMRARLLRSDGGKTVECSRGDGGAGPF